MMLVVALFMPGCRPSARMLKPTYLCSENTGLGISGTLAKQVRAIRILINGYQHVKIDCRLSHFGFLVR